MISWRSYPFKGSIYFWLTTLHHSPFPSIILHTHFAANALAKQWAFLMPQPPISFGTTIFFQENQGVNSFSHCPQPIKI